MSTKLRKSARGRNCEIRIPGICNHNPETVVLCHLNGGGMGTKNPDIFAAFGCHACHQAVDGVTGLLTAAERRAYLLDGILRTQAIWLKEGLIRHD